MSFRIDDILNKKHNQPEESDTKSLKQNDSPTSYKHYNFLQQLHYDETFLECAKMDKFYHQNANYYYGIPNRIWPNGAFILPQYLAFRYLPYTKKKGGQVRFTANQTDLLEKRFSLHKYVSPEDRKILADKLQLTDRQVKTWFQNRRAKWRRNSNSSTNLDEDNEHVTTTDQN